jgi:hypothetical protein
MSSHARPCSPPGACFGAAAGDFGDDAGGLGIGVAEADDLDRIAARFTREQGFAETRGILRDDGVGGAKDVAGRPEVLLEAEHHGIGKIACEPADVTDIGAAPPIDALVVIADHEDLILLGSEQPEPGELRKVDVLKLVSEHAVEPRRPACAVALAAWRAPATSSRSPKSAAFASRKRLW